MNKENALYQQDLRNIVSMPGIETLHGKTILITGATGMVGTHLIDALMLLGDVKVYAVGRDKNRAMDRLGSYYDSPLFTFVEQDVCNKFPSDIKPDIIIPLASNTHPLAYSQYPVETMLINIKGAEHALNLAVETGATVLYPYRKAKPVNVTFVLHRVKALGRSNVPIVHSRERSKGKDSASQSPVWPYNAND